jgi:hypothetical protein
MKGREKSRPFIVLLGLGCMSAYSFKMLLFFAQGKFAACVNDLRTKLRKTDWLCLN